MIFKKYKRPSVRLRATQDACIKGRKGVLKPPSSECTGGRLSLRHAGATEGAFRWNDVRF